MVRPNFAEKTFASGSKTMKFVKIFSLKSFPLYGILYSTWPIFVVGYTNTCVCTYESDVLEL